MSLLDYTTINCTLPTQQLSYICCLEAAGTWSGGAGGWCQFAEGTLSTMRESIRTWNQCAGRAAAVNTTLAGVLEASGALCAPSPGAQQRKQEDYLVPIICLVFLVWCYISSQQEKLDKLRKEVGDLRKELCEAGVKISAKYRPSGHRHAHSHKHTTGHDSEPGQHKDHAAQVIDEKADLISLV